MRTLLPCVSWRLAAGIVGLSVVVGASVAAAQDPKTDSSPPKPPPANPSTVGRSENPYLYAQRRRPPVRVTLVLRDSTIEYVLRELARSAGIRLAYPKEDPRMTRRINMSVANTPVLDAMIVALRGTGLQPSFTDERETIVTIQPATRQEKGNVSSMVPIDPEEPRPDRVVTLDSNVPSPLEREARVRPGATMLAGVLTTASGKQRELEVGTRVVSLNVDSIMQIAPVSSVTDLLEGRVPGLVVQRTSGSPGDPSRIRVRGTGSLARYNDPVIVIDGVRMYARQSDARNLNAGGFINGSGQRTSQYATPSPLDQLEPSVIERIEVLKGPSASALYGSDAANGVIVITTKRGRAGPTRWVASADQGISYVPGAGSLFDERHTPLKNGQNRGVNLTLSGGNSAIQYAYTAGMRKQGGVLKLPDVEQELYTQRNGVAAPGWMRDPDHLDALGGNGQVTIQANERVNIAFTNLMNSQTQKRTSMSNGLNGALGDLQRQLASGIPLDSLRLANYYEQVSSQSRNFLMALQIRYYPIEVIPITGTFGLGRLMREDKNLVARGTFDTPDSTGFYGGGEGTATERTVSVNTVIPVLNLADIGIGMNAQRGTVSDLRGSFRNIPLGVTTPSSGDVIEFTAPEDSWRMFGWFAESKIEVTPQLFVTPGIRIDNMALPGSSARYSTFPKLSVSWIASDEAYFPWRSRFPTLRIRGAIGYAGLSPTANEQLERYRSLLFNGTTGNNANSVLVKEPVQLERSLEMEGGGDLEMWRGRLRLDLTFYRKTRNDAVITMPFASSLPYLSPAQTYGDIRYSGTEFGLDVQILERRTMSWHGGFTMTRNSTQLLRVDEPSPVFFGTQLNLETFPPEAKNPNYQMAFNSGLTLFNGRVGLFTSVTYVSGMIQRNYSVESVLPDSGSVDGRIYGRTETVNALRWQTFSLNYEAPPMLTRLMRLGSMTLALQGANLGLRTNYSGLDPNVSAIATGNANFDTGQVPQPRTWQLRVTVRR